jgi:hypothetical protein
MEGHMPELWAGIDAGKAHHHCVLIDDEGNRLLSRKIANDEDALTERAGDTRVPDGYSSIHSLLLSKHGAPIDEAVPPRGDASSLGK